MVVPWFSYAFPPQTPQKLRPTLDVPNPNIRHIFQPSRLWPQEITVIAFPGEYGMNTSQSHELIPWTHGLYDTIDVFIDGMMVCWIPFSKNPITSNQISNKYH